MNHITDRSRMMYKMYGTLVLLILYFPVLSILLASLSKRRYFSFPYSDVTLKWYSKVFSSDTVIGLVKTSSVIALIVVVVSLVVGFFAALAYARYEWKGKRMFQKMVLIPLFFPQTVLGLALLLWFNFLNITPGWGTAVVAHLVWICPITTLIIAIQAYSLDPSLEEAAFDLGATRWQTLTQITLPLLSQSLVSAGLFAFLLSWGNFALSLFTTGADSTLPEWLYAKMVSGYSPLVPAVGTVSVIGATLVAVIGFGIIALQKRKTKTEEA